MEAMSGWTICATFSSTGIRARMEAIRASIAGSRATRLCTDGQWAPDEAVWVGGTAVQAVAASAIATSDARTFRPLIPTPLPLMIVIANLGAPGAAGQARRSKGSGRVHKAGIAGQRSSGGSACPHNGVREDRAGLAVLRRRL